MHTATFEESRSSRREKAEEVARGEATYVLQDFLDPPPHQRRGDQPKKSFPSPQYLLTPAPSKLRADDPGAQHTLSPPCSCKVATPRPSPRTFIPLEPFYVRPSTALPRLLT